MSGSRNAGSPSLEAVRALERELAEESAGNRTGQEALAAAREQAELLREAARARGVAAAEERRREALDEADREAARIRARAEREAEQLIAAMRVRLPETVAALAAVVVPPAEEP